MTEEQYWLEKDARDMELHKLRIELIYNEAELMRGYYEKRMKLLDVPSPL